VGWKALDAVAIIVNIALIVNTMMNTPIIMVRLLFLRKKLVKNEIETNSDFG
jgi:hypothetical protein